MPAVNGAPELEEMNGVVEEPPHNPSLDPIAIVGFAGRFPGKATNAKNLWDMCCQGQSAWSEVPKDRFNAEAYFHPNHSKSGCFNSRGAHFLKEDVGLFDAPFFNITPNEAKAMDPQQRLLLETTYEALENAGIPLNALAGTQTGVYVGAAQVDYEDLLFRDVDDIPVYQAIGTSSNTLANRISYVLDLKGSSITMNTACSSSLVALHLACQSLRTGENTQAIACGCHVMLNPDTMVGMSMIKVFGEEGICYTYDSRGSGYGRGEGAVSLVLKPLDAAIRDRDNIRAIIRNSGSNQDGKTNGITFPSGEAQADLMRSVYQSAGLDPLDTSYVEAHGTGTAAGDPVEAQAIASVFAERREIDNPLYVGSVKTNIGHLEAASGLAAIVKTVFALEEGVIPPNIHFEIPNKEIPLEEWKIKIPTTLTTWPKDSIKRASISNFGYGGTNAHVILEQYKPAEYTAESHKTDGESVIRETFDSQAQSSITGSKRRLFILSANDKVTLETQMSDLAFYLAQKKDIDDEEVLDRLAFTLGHRRSLLEWREAVSASTVLELSSALSDADGGSTKPSGKPTIGFVFTGQGAQWFAMGRELLNYPTFAKSLQEADGILTKFGAEWSLLDELDKDAKSSLVDQAYISQPATTAIQIALVRLLSSWGITPSAVVGHSSGEIGAAYAAGALSVEQCMLVAYHRGLAAETLKQGRSQRPGGMLAVGASPAKVRPMVKRLGSSHVVIACINGPSLVTASGDTDTISELQAEVESQGFFNRRLKVDVAYHSPHMRDIASDYLTAIKAVAPIAGFGVQFHSTVVGRQKELAELTAEYWVENMTNPVQFVDGVRSMYHKGEGPDTLIEVGPHSALEAPIRDIIKELGLTSKVRYFSSLVRNCDAALTALSLASALHVLGCDLNLSAINDPLSSSSHKILNDLPSYPWNHSKRYWHESRLSINHRLRRFPRSDLLGNLVDDFNENEPRWRNILRIADLPWLSDHKVQGSVIFPAAGYLTMAIEATSQFGQLHQISVTPSTKYKLREVRINRPMVLSEEAPTEISLVMRPQGESPNLSNSWLEFSVFSWTSETGWIEHSRGLTSLRENHQEPNPINGKRQIATERDQYHDTIGNLQSRCQITLSPVDIYSRFSRMGLEFGPSFRNIHAGRASTDCAICSISIPYTSKMMPKEFESGMLIHPGTFDACLQVADIAGEGGTLSDLDLHVPTSFKEITICPDLLNIPGNKVRVFATRSRPNCDFDSNVHTSFIVTDSEEEAKVLMRVQGYTASRIPNQDIEGVKSGDRGLCYQTKWEPCLDLMTGEQYTVTFNNYSNAQAATKQIENLERAAFYQLESAFQALSKENIDIPHTHLRDLHRVLRKLLIQVQQGDWPFQDSSWLSCDEEEKNRFLDSFSSSDDCGRLVCSVGENLVPIFKQEVEPLSIMLRDNMLESFYRSHESFKPGNKSCADIVLRLAHQNPNMHIIEIGAGTGATTMQVLRALGSKFAHYDFTDISSGFFERAREEQKEWSNKISYGKLNIEDDPIGQGFQPDTYDLVIAANVLHATVNMDNTMRNVRKLLRTGGKAVLVEITTQLLSNAISFGTLPGWWLGEEAERQDGPFLTENAWDSVYRRNGYSGLDGSVQVHSKGAMVASTMVTSAISNAKPSYPAASVVIYDGNHKNLGETISRSLQKLTGLPAPVENIMEVDLDDKYCIVLTMDDSLLFKLDETEFKRMQALFSTVRGVLWVSRGARSQHPEANMVIGFARSLRTENASLSFVTLDLDHRNQLSDHLIGDTISRVFKLTFGSDAPGPLADSEFLEEDGVLKIPRIVENQSKDEYVAHETHPPVPESQPFVQTGRPLALRIGQVGHIDSIYFDDDRSLKSELGSDEVEIAIKSIGMNFQDIMITLGQVPYNKEIGVECSGVVTAVGSNVTDMCPGTRVCCLASGTYANFVQVPRLLVAKIPESLGFAQAASIPIIFCTARYALSDIGRLSEGESVLIHAAAGGVGQAAIMLAQEAKAEVFVTVGTQNKKDLIIQTYGIPESHIFSSRDTSFHQELMAMTGQKGVDVVLNSTSGEILRQSWQCLATHGRFIEIGKRDLAQNSKLDMEKFLDCASFSGVDLWVLGQTKPQIFQRILFDVIKMYESNVIHLVNPVTVYPVSEIQQAMRQMQNGKHTGKIIIEAGADDVVQTLPSKSMKVLPDGNASYLITGGTGGLGRSITRWLARQGAKHIILLSRSGMSQKGVSELVEELQGQDVDVVVEQCDVADGAQVQKVLSERRQAMPPIKGVIHGAMALRDAVFEKLSFADWQLNITPRVQGAWNLHHCLSDTDLDFFLMLGSVAGQIGSVSQSAYAATNTFFNAFASYRKGLGLPASVIDIGRVAKVGYIAENTELGGEVSFLGHDSLAEDELLALLKAHITDAFAGNEDQQTITGLKLLPEKPLPPWAFDLKFQNVLANVQSDTSTISGDDGDDIAVRDRLKQAQSLEQATKLICHALVRKLSSLLLITIEDVDTKKPVVAYGLDSLVAVELRNWITTDLDATVPLMELMNSPSMNALAGKIATRSKSVDRSVIFPEGKDQVQGNK